MNIFKGIDSLIGNTPLFLPANYIKNENIKATVLCKLERFNPAGSAKDRIALFIIDDAEKNGILKEDATIIEPTSGNTGIGIAAVAASRGYKVILTMPETMSIERRSLLAAYGAKIVLTPGKLGMKGAVDEAIRLSKAIDNSFIPSQFENAANPKAHYSTTGPEIYRDTDGKVDIFVAGIGTGGTITGVGKYLKAKNPDVRVIGIEPDTSPLISKGYSGPHGLQGIGANFIPSILDLSLVDDILTVSTDEAYTASKKLARSEGILCGITSGAALHVATVLSKLPENAGKTIVALLPDTGERYLSTQMFEDNLKG